jgi:hypothetical protein
MDNFYVTVTNLLENEQCLPYISLEFFNNDDKSFLAKFDINCENICESLSSFDKKLKIGKFAHNVLNKKDDCLSFNLLNGEIIMLYSQITENMIFRMCNNICENVFCVKNSQNLLNAFTEILAMIR